MSTDMELLELAAKAAGLNVKAQQVDGDDNFVALVVGKAGTRERENWNPLTDDGDALRLAVKLKIDIEFYAANDIEGDSVGAICSKGICSVYCRENTALNPDINAATRRAITRAAAEIGRAMP